MSKIKLQSCNTAQPPVITAHHSLVLPSLHSSLGESKISDWNWNLHHIEKYFNNQVLHDSAVSASLYVKEGIDKIFGHLVDII